MVSEAVAGGRGGQQRATAVAGSEEALRATRVRRVSARRSSEPVRSTREFWACRDGGMRRESADRSGRTAPRWRCSSVRRDYRTSQQTLACSMQAAAAGARCMWRGNGWRCQPFCQPFSDLLGPFRNHHYSNEYGVSWSVRQSRNGSGGRRSMEPSRRVVRSDRGRRSRLGPRGRARARSAR